MSSGKPGSEEGSAERLWARYRRNEAGTARGLNLESIVRAAITIADAKGIADLSMATIAQELGYSTMALYRHVQSKADLLQIMVDAAVGPPPGHIHEQKGWRAQLTEWGMEIAAAYRRHQWIFDVPVSGPPVMPNSLRWMEAGLTILQQTGLDPDELVGLLTTITSYLRGNEQLLAEVMRHGVWEDPGSGAQPETYGGMLRRLIPKGELPVLEGIVATGVLDADIGASMIDDHEMDLRFGLDLLLDGIEKLVERRCGPGQSSAAPGGTHG